MRLGRRRGGARAAARDALRGPGACVCACGCCRVRSHGRGCVCRRVFEVAFTTAVQARVCVRACAVLASRVSSSRVVACSRLGRVMSAVQARVRACAVSSRAVACSGGWVAFVTRPPSIQYSSAPVRIGRGPPSTRAAVAPAAASRGARRCDRAAPRRAARAEDVDRAAPRHAFRRRPPVCVSRHLHQVVCVCVCVCVCVRACRAACVRAALWWWVVRRVVVVVVVCVCVRVVMPQSSSAARLGPVLGPRRRRRRPRRRELQGALRHVTVPSPLQCDETSAPRAFRAVELERCP